MERTNIEPKEHVHFEGYFYVFRFMYGQYSGLFFNVDNSTYTTQHPGDSSYKQSTYKNAVEMLNDIKRGYGIGSPYGGDIDFDNNPLEIVKVNVSYSIS